MRDALRLSRAPFSHSNDAAIASRPRNVPDDVLRVLPQNGGVIHENLIAERMRSTVRNTSKSLTANAMTARQFAMAPAMLLY